MRIFEAALFFQATYYIKTDKQTISKIDAGRVDAGWLAERKGKLMLGGLIAH